MTKLEEMAKAAYNATWTPGRDGWDALRNKWPFIAGMVEALKVLRDPTPEMIAAVGWQGKEDLQAMIDVVLEEKS